MRRVLEGWFFSFVMKKFIFLRLGRRLLFRRDCLKKIVEGAFLRMIIFGIVSRCGW